MLARIVRMDENKNWWIQTIILSILKVNIMVYTIYKIYHTYLVHELINIVRHRCCKCDVATDRLVFTFDTSYKSIFSTFNRYIMRICLLRYTKIDAHRNITLGIFCRCCWLFAVFLSVWCDNFEEYPRFLTFHFMHAHYILRTNQSVWFI